MYLLTPVVYSATPLTLLLIIVTLPALFTAVAYLPLTLQVLLPIVILPVQLTLVVAFFDNLLPVLLIIVILLAISLPMPVPSLVLILLAPPTFLILLAKLMACLPAAFSVLLLPVMLTIAILLASLLDLVAPSLVLPLLETLTTVILLDLPTSAGLFNLIVYQLIHGFIPLPNTPLAFNLPSGFPFPTTYHGFLLPLPPPYTILLPSLPPAILSPVAMAYLVLTMLIPVRLHYPLMLFSTPPILCPPLIPLLAGFLLPILPAYPLSLFFVIIYLIIIMSDTTSAPLL